MPNTQSDTPTLSSPDESRERNVTSKPNKTLNAGTRPKVVAGGLGASLATNLILVAQEFLPHWEPTPAFVGAVSALAGMLFAYVKREMEN